MKPPSVRCRSCLNRQRSVFCDLDRKQLEELEASKITNRYRKHQIIFYEGNKPYGLYCLASGKVKIYKVDTLGHQQIVRLAGPGDMLGYRCLLAEESYLATAETLEESEVCFFDRKTFLQILKTHPATTMHVLSVLAKDLGKAETQVVNIVHKNIRERLAELLVHFQTQYGEKTKNGIHLTISLSRAELAELIGTTQESVIRLISEFKQNGWIAVEGREITLLDMKKIMETANVPEFS